MEESNLRVLRPWRHYIPGPAWYSFRVRMRKLDSYICAILRARWQGRLKGILPAKPDILDRILAAIQAGIAKTAPEITIWAFLCTV